MYYAHFILNKKGPLAKIWLAAHWDKKLTKAQIYETNIESTIEAILEPQMKLALRTSGHLLLGICRIYSRKVKYLLADCNEAFVKIKLAFRPGLIDLPKEKQQAAAEAITLPEKFPEFLVNFPEINMDMDMELGLGPKSMGSLATQMARVEDITLKEDFGSSAMVTMQDDDFGDMGMGGAASFGMDTFMFSDVERGRHMADNSAADAGVSGLDAHGLGLNKSNSTHANDRADLQKSNLKEISAMELGDLDSNLDNQTAGKGPDDTLMQDLPEIDNEIEMTGKLPNVPTLFDEQPTVAEGADNRADDELRDEVGVTNKTSGAGLATTTAAEKQNRARRKRKLVIDEVKEIDSATMRAQLSDTSSILGTLELAPPTRKLMHLKEIGGVDKLFTMTGRPIHNKIIAKLYTRNMVTKSLLDITNQLKEKARDENGKHLPLADSYIDAHDVTRGEIVKDASRRDFDDYDNYAAPGSVFNNQNFDDMLENPEAEVTPSKLKSAGGGGSDSDSAESDDEDDGENKTRNKSAAHKKRSYRKSINATLTNIKDQTTLKDELEEDGLLMDGSSSLDPAKNLTKRAKTMVSLLNKSFNKQDNVSFFEMIRRNGKKSVVQKFYSLLVLKKHEIIEVTQAETFGDVIISKGEKFDTFAPN